MQISVVIFSNFSAKLKRRKPFGTKQIILECSEYRPCLLDSQNKVYWIFSCLAGWPFYAGVIASAGHLAWQVSSVDIHSRADCNSK